MLQKRIEGFLFVSLLIVGGGALFCAAGNAHEGEVGAEKAPGEGKSAKKFHETLDQWEEAAKSQGKDVSSSLEKIYSGLKGFPPEKQADFFNRWSRMKENYDRARAAENASPPNRDAAKRYRASAVKIKEGIVEAIPGAGDVMASIRNVGVTAGIFTGKGGRPSDSDFNDARRDAARYGHNRDAQLGAGKTFQAGEKPKEAASYFQRAKEIDPSSADAYSGLAQSLAQPEIGDWQGAWEAGKRAVELGSRDPGLIATLRMAKQRIGASGAEPRAVPASAPPPRSAFSDSNAPVSPVRGASNFAALNVDEKYKNVRDANQFVEASEKLVRSSPRRAVEYADKSLEAMPDNPRAYLAKANAYLRMQNYAAAIAAIRGAVRHAKPGMKSRLLTKQAEIFNRMGNHKDALASAKLAIGADLKNAHAYAQASWAFSGTGDAAGAVSMLERAAGLDGRYRRLLARMRSLPEEGDMLALFEGRPQPAREARESAPTDHSIFKNKKAFWWLALAAAVVFLGVGLVGAVSDSFKDTIRRKLSGSTAPALETAGGFEGMAGAEPGRRAREELLGGSHRIEGQIGAGGMGVVYKAHDTQLDRPVAVKKMRDEIRSDPRERERFLKEARTVAALRNTNIVEIYQILEQGQDVYLVFEYVSGKTISQLIYERKKMALGDSLAIMRGVAAALDFAHGRNVIHRDLKPSNVMIDDGGEVKVMDFGVARQAKESVSRMSMTNTVVGTPPYMAPEQEQGMVRKESDVFALAVCLYEMVTGELPYRGVGAGMLMAKMNQTYAPASKIVSDLPAEFDAIMAKGLDPDPDKRWKTAGEFVRALDPFVAVS